MQVTDIPFNRHLGMHPSANGEALSLSYRPEVTNHLKTVHAGALFSLAEACSGQFLLSTFPGREEEHLAVLRKSEVRYRNQTQHGVTAVAAAGEEELAAFIDRLDKRGRALITVAVTVRDEAGAETMQGRFEWFVQRRADGEESES